MASAIDPTVFDADFPTKSGAKANATAAKDEIDALQDQTQNLDSSGNYSGTLASGTVLDLPQINDTSDDHQYVFAVSELTADRTVTLPLLTGNDTFMFEAHAQTLTNKTFDLTNNTLSGTTAQFNTALSDGDFATLAGTETLTNKTVDLTDNTLQGSKTEFNTALESDTFVMTSDAGTEYAAPTGSNAALESFVVAASDETTALATGTGKVAFRMPYAFTVTEVRASLTTAQSSGTIFTVDINEAGTTILSTKLTIDNGEKTSTTAATAAVVSDSALADDAEMTIDIDQIGAGDAAGLKVTIIGRQA